MGCTYKYHSQLPKLIEIKNTVQDIFNIENIEEKTRKRKFVDARAAYAFFAKKYTHASLEYIMKQVGKNHDVYYNSMKVVETNLLSRKEFRIIFNSLELHFNKKFNLNRKIEVKYVNLLENKIEIA